MVWNPTCRKLNIQHLLLNHLHLTSTSMLSLRRRRKYQTSDPTIILWQMGSLDSVQGKAGIRKDGNWHALYVAFWQWFLGTIHIKIYESFPLCKVTRHYLLDAIMNWVKMMLSIDIFLIYFYFLGRGGKCLVKMLPAAVDILVTTC